MPPRERTPARRETCMATGQLNRQPGRGTTGYAIDDAGGRNLAGVRRDQRGSGNASPELVRTTLESREASDIDLRIHEPPRARISRLWCRTRWRVLRYRGRGRRRWDGLGRRERRGRHPGSAGDHPPGHDERPARELGIPLDLEGACSSCGDRTRRRRSTRCGSMASITSPRSGSASTQ